MSSLLPRWHVIGVDPHAASHSHATPSSAAGPRTATDRGRFPPNRRAFAVPSAGRRIEGDLGHHQKVAAGTCCAGGADGR